MPDPNRELYAAEIERHVLALRESLVRHDENLKAWYLLESVPYFIEDRPAIIKARRDQYAMIRHVLQPGEQAAADRVADVYGDYYATNPHERTFEEQYGISPELAHQHMHRVAFLREGLKRQCESAGVIPQKLKVLDLSANDGWMAVNLGQLGYTTDCVDLHPGNCEVARTRKQAREGIGQVLCCDLHSIAPEAVGGSHACDAVVCFETLEHVPDPDFTMSVMAGLCKPGGRLYVSTPLEAVEQGNVPNWDHVEPKGHVRVFRERDLRGLLNDYGNVMRFEIGPERVMAAEVAPYPAEALSGDLPDSAPATA